MSTQSHALFEQYPLNGEADISVGTVPTPYQTYDGHGTFIGGTANLDTVTEQLKSQDVYPIATTDGHAVMGIWVVDFTDASLGAHTELQYSILVSHRPVPAIESHRLTLLKALFTNPDARMFCYRLWNNTEKVVAYNREVLGLDVQLTRSTIQRQDNSKMFRFMDDHQQPIFEGHVHEANRAIPQVGWQLFRLLGLRSTLQAFTQSYIGAKVVNPKSDRFPFNADAQSYVASDPPIVQFFNSDTDSITFGQSDMQTFDFQPQFVEHFAPFRFVYLTPEKMQS